MARYSPPLLRRFFSCAASSASPAGGSGAGKKNLVFLGSPQVAASVLDTLLAVSGSPDAGFQVAAVVTQPPAAKNRGRKLTPSAVAQLALDRGFPEELIFTPERAREESFLLDLKEVKPDVCITAAYGNILPQKFLDIPLRGTVNIHPSLLPLYRGAAPVQRALQDGVAETGVSLAYTVRALDAGPVIACGKFSVDEYIKAPELLAILFDIGSKLLINELPSILDGSAKEKAQPQDDSKATLAPKLNSEESWLSFDREAKELHNKVLELQLPGKKVMTARDFWNGLRGQKLLKSP
ncbi:Methionyl-tRNA formyltransferase [Dichanthelium oligosanthes]|uniref:methionyl-tRNA formyltransferase n=1 Tax=Dichanthelium oligosanthes TaxID=888268 RepID=A0A1E5UW08_9POAL|nr:Methionyl-tRNA formyltransferase [Dichanthelium oligosanthes]